MDGQGRGIGEGTLYGPLACRGRDTGTARRRQRTDRLSLTQPSAKIADGNSPSHHGHTHHPTPVTPCALSTKNISSSFSPRIGPHTGEHCVLPSSLIFLPKDYPQDVPKRPHSTSMTRFGVPRARFKTRHPGSNRHKTSRWSL